MKKSKIIIIVIVGLIVGIINYLIYPMVVDLSIKTIKVPVVCRTIKANEPLLESDIVYIPIPEGYLPSDVIVDPTDYLGLYVKTDYTITSNSFLYPSYFYNRDIKEKQLLINVPIDTSYTKIELLNDRCNLYFTANVKINDEYIIVNGILGEDVQIKEKGTTSLVLVVNEELFDYLVKAMTLGTVIPVNVYVESNVDYYSPNKLKAFINEYCLNTQGDYKNAENR